MSNHDVIIVGAGPAGSAAALVLARAGKNVIVVERGPFPGSKNMYGGVVYGRVLDDLIPNWWDEVPVQRWVTRRQTMVTGQRRALTVDYRTANWGEMPYNGFTTLRPDFDSWLAGHAEAAGATYLNSTTVTGLLRDGGRVVGVATDRGELTASLVLACDGANSFLAKEAGMYPGGNEPTHYTLGVKEVLGFDKHTIDERFGVRGKEGVDIEILGCTGAVGGGGFVYTNIDTVAVGCILKLTDLQTAQRRPESFIADLKEHPSIAPLIEGGDLKEYSAHLIPEGGYDAMPEIVGNGMLVAGDAAGMCLAAGLYIEGVNFAIGSGMIAARTAITALRRGDVSPAGLASYRTRLEASFVLADHKKFRAAPHLVLSERVQQQYPEMICDIVEGMFTVENPKPKRGVLAVGRAAVKKHGVKLRHLARDSYEGLKAFR